MRRKVGKTFFFGCIIMALVFSFFPLFTVNASEEEVGPPPLARNVRFLPNEGDNGFAGGKITFTVPGYSSLPEGRKPTEAVLFFGNGEGGILSDYSGLRRKISGEEVTLAFPSGVMIPSSAKEIILYLQNSQGVAGSVRIPLPEGIGFSEKGHRKLLEMQIISDLHITSSGSMGDLYWEKILKSVEEFSPESAGIQIVGDAVDGATAAQYRMLRSVWQKERSKNPSVPYVYYGIGNHEFKDQDRFGSIGPYGDPGERIETFLKNADLLNGDLTVDKVYYDYYLGPIHCVVLGSEYCIEGDETTGSSGKGKDAFLSDAQLRWLAETLEADDSGNPIFLFLHSSLYNTVAGGLELPGGTRQKWNGIIAGDEYRGQQNLSDGSVAKMLAAEQKFRDILKDHTDRVFFFNGHTHWSMMSEGNMMEATDLLPTTFNTGSAAYLMDDFSIPTGMKTTGSQGYFVTVYDDLITVRGYNFATERWVMEAQYAIPFSTSVPEPEKPTEPEEPENSESEEPEDLPKPVSEEPEKKNGCAGALSASACLFGALTVFAAILWVKPTEKRNRKRS